MNMIALALAVVLGGFAVKGTAPNFKSPRNFYRSGDSVTVTLRDSTLDVAMCIVGQRASYYYQIEKQDGKQWTKYYVNEGPCPAQFPTTSEVLRGFTIGHRIGEPGVYRFRVSGQFLSNSFEVR